MFTNRKTAIIFTAFILFLIIIKSTGLFNWYNMVTNTMEPAIKKHSNVFVSNLFKYDNNDIIVFEDKYFSEPVIFRLIGKTDDKIQIKSGALFVNGKKVNDENKLPEYKVPRGLFFQIIESEKIFHSYEPAQLTYIDTFRVAAYRNYAKSLNLEELIYDKSYEEKEIEETYNKKWNRDNFGPLVIPKSKLFVLGDNRGNSIDSRYFGLVDIEYVKGKVLF
ncbi:signal peptidase I [Psychroflexus sp. MES1-P1E]|uniref:signal peptidase I n=1 Tax=Psychroflexus sp. MES1-P1E TaxID=2058320 RepID=UPI000C7B1D2F|nr:signal peptidase I [Psychroflexus sp. MES1-P1E]PKG43845.1 hypothetical protein CXF67_02880 [Psychroflexus sp. MES1-P1E]